MNLVVGIICRDHIVFASDSDLESVKMNSVEFGKVRPFREQVLLIQTGSAYLSKCVLEVFRKKAEKAEITHNELPAQILRESLLEIASQRSSLPSGNHTHEEWKHHFRDQGAFDVTIAYYFGKIPQIYHITLDECVYVKPPFYYAASGVGQDLATFLLPEYCTMEMEYWQGSLVASSVVEIVREQLEQGYVSKTRIGMIRPWKSSYPGSSMEPELLFLPEELHIFGSDQIQIFFREYLGR